MLHLEEIYEAVCPGPRHHPWFKSRAARMQYVVALHQAQRAHQNNGDARSILEAAFLHAPVFRQHQSHPAPRLQNPRSPKWERLRKQSATEHLEGLRSALDHSKAVGRELPPPSGDCYWLPSGERAIWIVIPREALALAHTALTEQVQVV
jgi:hypothetical protein